MTASAETSDARTGWPGTELSLATAALAASTWVQSVPSSDFGVHRLHTAPLSAARLVAPDSSSLYCVLMLLVPSPFAALDPLQVGARVFRAFFTRSTITNSSTARR